MQMNQKKYIFGMSGFRSLHKQVKQKHVSLEFLLVSPEAPVLLPFLGPSLFSLVFRVRDPPDRQWCGNATRAFHVSFHEPGSSIWVWPVCSPGAANPSGSGCTAPVGQLRPFMPPEPPNFSPRVLSVSWLCLLGGLLPFLLRTSEPRGPFLAGCKESDMT